MTGSKAARVRSVGQSFRRPHTTRTMLVALTWAALAASCGASSQIFFGSVTELVRRSSECVLSDGRQGRCMYPSSCEALSGPQLPDCVKPCAMVQHELKVCCPTETTSSGDTTTTRTCGRPGTPPTLARNIAFGRRSAPGRWPWMALLGWRESTGSGRHRWRCGGALISQRHVLTAAHCVERAGAPLTVRLGEHDLTETADGRHQDVLVAHAAVPAGRRGHQQDLALLTLAEPARLSAHVQPVCLPSSAADDPAVGDDVVVAGWGRVQYSEPRSDHLREAVQQVRPTGECERAYRRVPGFEDNYPGGLGSRLICALDTTAGHQDSCRGDSGGPLVARATDGTYTAVGVVSLGMGCGNPAFGSLYTRVSSYLDWIERQMARPQGAHGNTTVTVVAK
ncbi:venom protease-like [Amphibalanus amphitrite]|uniref:venom protease-like n=1 Tax=Amphibalanus amphitrite TaxID=1232801 RepID=UPI001C90C848|nr:venom protease-like [Amphibalanus amphitrite]